jgi:hypothetical protein
MTKVSGNIRKMQSKLDSPVDYKLPLFDVLEPNHLVPLNQLLGKQISITFENAINCVVTGKKIKKAYGEGMSYDAFMSSPLAVESIIRPELSRIHEGIALRDLEWETQNHLQPHYTYLSNTSGLKVGVTRTTQIPTRWIDQGATQALIIAETPYRQAAGLIEVALKNHLADKTNWQMMLKSNPVHLDLLGAKEKFAALIPDELKQWIKPDTTETIIQYPILRYPEKIKSLKLDTNPLIEGVLTGIKGQYLMINDQFVINIRSHTGYLISFEY